MQVELYCLLSPPTDSIFCFCGSNNFRPSRFYCGVLLPIPMLNSNLLFLLDILPATELMPLMFVTGFFKLCFSRVSYVESLRFFLVFSLSFASFYCICLIVLAFACCYVDTFLANWETRLPPALIWFCYCWTLFKLNSLCFVLLYELFFLLYCML